MKNLSNCRTKSYGESRKSSPKHTPQSSQEKRRLIVSAETYLRSALLLLPEPQRRWVIANATAAYWEFEEEGDRRLHVGISPHYFDCGSGLEELVRQALRERWGVTNVAIEIDPNGYWGDAA
jgi:hypothetical protein